MEICTPEEEQEAFGRLTAQRMFAEQLLKEPDQLLSQEQVSREGFEKLHDTAKKYEAAIEAIMIAGQEDANNLVYKEQWYKARISEQMTAVDLLLNQLYEAINAFNVPTLSKSTELRGKRLFKSINFKIKAAKTLIQTKPTLSRQN